MKNRGIENSHGNNIVKTTFSLACVLSLSAVLIGCGGGDVGDDLESKIVADGSRDYGLVDRRGTREPLSAYENMTQMSSEARSME